MVNATCALWLSVPEVAVSVAVAAPAAALNAAFKLIDCCTPGVSVKLGGVAATPEGSPLKETFTMAANPLTAEADTWIACAPPPEVRAIVAGETESAKSALGAAGVSGTGAGAIAEPPHATTTALSARAAANSATFHSVDIVTTPGLRRERGSDASFQSKADSFGIDRKKGKDATNTALTPDT